MRKKIHKLEKEEGKDLLAKFIFIFTLAILALLSYKVFIKQLNKEKKSILGETTRLKESLPKSLPKIEKKYLPRQKNLSSISDTLSEKANSTISKIIENFIYKNAASKIAQEFEKLPPAEKQEIKKQICK